MMELNRANSGKKRQPRLLYAGSNVRRKVFVRFEVDLHKGIWVAKCFLFTCDHEFTGSPSFLNREAEIRLSP